LVVAWSAILAEIGDKKRAVWTALTDTQVVALADDVVTIGFVNLGSAEILKKPQGPGLAVNAELVRDAIMAITGHRVRFKVSALPQESVPAEAEASPEVVEESAGDSAPNVVPDVVSDVASNVAPDVVETVVEQRPEATETSYWPTISLPGAEPEREPEVVAHEAEPEDVAPATSGLSQVGEAVIREILGGQLIAEHPVDDGESR
jgi:hypothetical protein